MYINCHTTEECQSYVNRYHRMVLYEPTETPTLNTGLVSQITTRCMSQNAKIIFAKEISQVRWEPLYRLGTCEEQHAFYQKVMDDLIQYCFPLKSVTRHSADKPWVTDNFRSLIRKRQRARMSGDMEAANMYRNMVNRAAPHLRYDFYQFFISPRFIL